MFVYISAFILVCRRNAVGPVYTSPNIVSRGFLFAYTIGVICLAVWVILWDQSAQWDIIYVIAPCSVLGAAALMFWIATGIIHYK